MHIHTHKWRVRGSARVTRKFMDPCGPRHVYVPYGHFSLIIPYLFFPYFFTKRLYHPLHHRQSHDRLSPSSQHHVLLQPPYILLLFIRTISPYFTCINQVDTTLYLILIWVICSLSQHLFKVLIETGSTAAFKLSAYIASDFLVLPLSPSIIICIHIIFAQDLHLLF